MSSADHVFGGRYRIVGEVGRGGMGVIYRGIDSVLDREVAIKVMSTDFNETTDETRERFFREAKAAARLQHRNIVTVFEFAEQDGVPYIVMEFLKGQSLSSRMGADPPMSLEQKLDVMTELCNGLQFAHENGVVHRDVKPGNVWLVEDGAVKLVDFGIAKISSSMMTLHGDVMGSASYMSPEQIEGGAVTGRSDVFSASVMLYEMLARRRPFEGDSPTATMMQIVHQPPPPIESLAPGLPAELIAAISRGLEKNPDERYQSAAEFGAELQLIRMALPRDEATIIQHAREHDTLGTLPLRAEPLPRRVEALTGATAGQSGMSPQLKVFAAAALVVVVAIGWWMTRSPAPGPAQKGQIAGVPEPPPPPPVPTVLIESTPPGAAITLNGADTGQVTPARVAVATTDTMRLSLKDYESKTIVLTEADVRRDALRFSLTANEAPRVQVEISGEYPFEVYDGSRQLSGPSRDHTVPARAGQVLTLKSAEYFLNQPYTVKVRNGRAEPIVVPDSGDIVLNGNEACMVILDGRRLDYLRSQLPPLAAGSHTFSFECRDGSKLRSMTLTIDPGKNPSREVR